MSAFDPIGAIEGALVDRISAAFTNHEGKTALKKCEAIEIPVDPATEKTLGLHPPGVYVAPLQTRPGQTDNALTVMFGIYCVSGRASSRARTKGGGGAWGIGAYAIMIRTWLSLAAWTPPVDCAGTLRLVGAENLTGILFINRSMHCWAITVSCELGLAYHNPFPGPAAGDPHGTNTSGTDPNGADPYLTDLADFQIFHTDWDVPPADDPPTEPLPAARDAASTVEPQT